MAFRLYVVPIVGTGAHGDARRPKYFTDGTIAMATWSAVGYGLEPWTIVGADLPAGDDAIIAGKPDVQALPFDLSPLLTTGQVSSVKTFLENANIPAGWVDTTDTWAVVVRGVLGMFSFLERYSGIYAEQNGTAAPSIFLGGVTLATTFGSLPQAVQTAMLATATDQGISTAGLAAGTTLRVILRFVADTYSARVYDFNGHAV
jgi:hypothetical protein